MLKNPLLQKALAEIEKGVTNRDAYDKIVSAATKTIYDEKVFASISRGIAEAEDPVADAAKGIVAILGTLASKARGTMPHDAATQAGMALMLDALDFMEQAGLLKVDNETLDRAAQDFIEAMLPSTGITSDKLTAALADVQKVMGNQEQMRAYEAAQKGGA